MQNQAYTFAIFILNGFLIGLLFDFFRILRKTFKTADLITYIEDVIFWILSGFSILYTIFKFNNGVLRIYIFIGIILGIVIYMLIFSKVFTIISVYIINVVKRAITVVIVKPIIFILNILKKIIFKPISFIFINVRKILSKFRINLTKSKKIRRILHKFVEIYNR